MQIKSVLFKKGNNHLINEIYKYLQIFFLHLHIVHFLYLHIL